MTSYQKIIQHYKGAQTLVGIQNLLQWDMETFLPRNSQGVRALQLSKISTAIHQEMTDPAFLKLVLEKEGAYQPQNDIEARQLALIKKEVLKSQAFDKDFVGELSTKTSASLSAWKQARVSRNFKDVEKPFGELVRIQQEWAQRLKEHREAAPYYAHSSLYEIHIDQYEPSMKFSFIQKWMDDLIAGTKTVLPKIFERQIESGEQAAGPTAFSMRATEQMDLNQKISKLLGFDFEKGRLDQSIHPFCGGYLGDVRLTTRIRVNDFTESLFGVIHETGHGIYEQNLPEEFYLEPIGRAASFGVHESQSRFFENQIGRSFEFCQYLSTLIPGLNPEKLYDHVNHVKKSFIRTEADEVTYNLHIALRIDIEKKLIDGGLSVSELPEYWNAQFEKIFGLKVEDPVKGCLQDIHWYGGSFGYFPSYSIGNILASELFDELKQTLPEWKQLITKGEFGPIRQLLKDRVHGQGAKRDALESMQYALKNREPRTETLLRYLETKYS